MKRLILIPLVFMYFCVKSQIGDSSAQINYMGHLRYDTPINITSNLSNAGIVKRYKAGLHECAGTTIFVLDYDFYTVPDRIIIRDSLEVVLLDTWWVGSGYQDELSTLPGFRLNQDYGFGVPHDYMVNTSDDISGKGRIQLAVGGHDFLFIDMMMNPIVASNLKYFANIKSLDCELVVLDTTIYYCGPIIEGMEQRYVPGECCDTLYNVNNVRIGGIPIDTTINLCYYDDAVYEFPNHSMGVIYIYGIDTYYPGEQVVLEDGDNQIQIVFDNCEADYIVHVNRYQENSYLLDTTLLLGDRADMINLPIDIPTGEDFFYRGEYTDTNGCLSNALINIDYKSLDYYIPNAISPNGDGINDCLMIYNQEFISSYTIKIWDRWGGLVADTNGDWCPNSTLNDGVYVVVVSLSLTDGKSDTYKGELNIVR